MPRLTKPTSTRKAKKTAASAIAPSPRINNKHSKKKMGRRKTHRVGGKERETAVDQIRHQKDQTCQKLEEAELQLQQQQHRLCCWDTTVKTTPTTPTSSLVPLMTKQSQVS